MKIHIVVNHQARYMEYALACMDSLIHKGGVLPQDILVSSGNGLEYNYLPRQFFKKYPVNVIGCSPNMNVVQKFSVLEQAFKFFPNEESILQLDSDTVLTREIDFMGMLNKSNRNCDLLSYIDPGGPNQQLARRFALLTGDFRVDGDEKKINQSVRLDRLNLWCQAVFGAPFTDFFEWCKTSQWVYGGFFIINRSLFEKTKEWNAIKSVGAISICDETAIKMAQWAASIGTHNYDIRELVTPNFVHTVCPHPLDFNNPSIEMVHYAADRYRFHHAENRNKICDLIADITTRF